jgi:hypothetical protein
MKGSLGRKFAVLAIVVMVVGFVFLWARQKANTTNWVEVGISGLDGRTFPYRYIGDEKDPPTHHDLVGLTLDLQSGKARGAWVMAPVSQCYAPQIRDGVPSITCESINREAIIIGGADNIREILLSLRSDQVGAVRGKAMGLYADHPVLWVNDPALKRTVN